MTREQIYWAIALSVVANLFTWIFIQPALSWIRSNTIDRIPLRRAIRWYFYLTVAHRNTSLATLIGYATPTLLCSMATYHLPHTRYLSMFLSTSALYTSLSFSIALIMQVLVEGRITLYDTLRAKVRPIVDESFLVTLDSKFTQIRTRADYDAIIDALIHAPQTHPQV